MANELFFWWPSSSGYGHSHLILFCGLDRASFFRVLKSLALGLLLSNSIVSYSTMLNFSEPLLTVVLGELMDVYVPSAFYLADELLLAMWVFCPIKSPSSPGLLSSNCRGWEILPSIPMWSRFGSDPCVAKPKLEFTIRNLHGCTLTCSEFKLKTQTGILLKWAFDPRPMSSPIHSHYCKFYICLLQGCSFSTELGFLNVKPKDLPDIYDIKCLWVVLIIRTCLHLLSIVWVVKTFDLLPEDASLSQ